jgi:hypothetical protein
MSILRKTPLPLVADDFLLEYIRFKNMGLIGKDEPSQEGMPPIPTQGHPMNKVAFELGYKYAIDAKMPPGGPPKGPPLFGDLLGPQRSIWERMIVGQLMGDLPGRVAGRFLYPDDPESQATLSATTGSLGALGAISYPEILRAMGKYDKPSSIGFKEVVKNL